MKTLDHKNFYEVLEVPADAGVGDIKRAYHDALSIYDDDAMVTYSLFSDEQRADILDVIERAFNTLIDEEKRLRYNQSLDNSSRAFAFSGYGRNHKGIDLLAYARNKSKEDSLQIWVQMKSKDNHIQSLVEKVLAKDRISGKELKSIRCAYGVEIAEIYEITRISSAVITHIEQDRFDMLPAEIFLKRFLRSYAELLQMDPQTVIDGYLENMP